MRMTVRLRTLMGVVVVVAGLLGTAVGIPRRAESFRRLAAYHYQASSVLIDRAGGPLSCGTGLTDSDIAQAFCNRGFLECRAYRASLYHSDLAEKYRGAANCAWLPVPRDPPPPPEAFPDFDADPLFYDLANDIEIVNGLK